MKIQVIADSCCDVTPAMRTALHLKSAPLKVTVDGTKQYIDDGNVNIKQLVADMKASKKPIATAAPSPEDYASLMRDADAAVVVTLSHHLSGSYNGAMAAREIIREETPEKPVLVFDSKSASAGELRIVLYIESLIAAGATMDQLAEKVPLFINRMRTLFVLEDLSNLIKNGRIPKMAGMIGTVLMLRPIMGEDGDGQIVPIEKVRGTRKALERLVELVQQRTAEASAGSLLMTLSHCNCPQRAIDLKKQLLAHCPALGEIIVTPTGALSAGYANDGGVILAYA